MSDLHFPKVRIITPSGSNGWTETVLTRVEVDGELWPVFTYKVESTAPDLVDVGHGLQHIQSVTLTFSADVTVERAE